MAQSTLTLIATMEKDIEFIKEALNWHMKVEEARNLADIQWKKELLEHLETKFAWKWTEKILIFVWTGIWIALIWAIMALILKN